MPHGDEKQSKGVSLMDKSDFFSVSHTCNINVKPVKELPSPETFESEIPTPFRMSSEVSHIDAASLRCLRGLGEGSDELVSYLKMQAQKTDIILGYVLSLQDEPSERYQTLSLSAGGLSFESTSPLDSGTCLRLKLFLSSEALAIYCYGEVTSCEELSEQSYRVEVRFNRLRETDQEHLIRACLHIQTQQLKARSGQV